MRIVRWIQCIGSSKLTWVPHWTLVNDDAAWFVECDELVTGIVGVVVAGRASQNIERAGVYTTTHTLQRSQKSKSGQSRHL